jgi:hypothetical protein
LEKTRKQTGLDGGFGEKIDDEGKAGGLVGGWKLERNLRANDQMLDR